MRKVFGQLRMYQRFAWGLPKFVRTPMTIDQARARIRRELVRREENFLRLVRLGVVGKGSSPYARLLRMAGCEYGDLEVMTRADGLDAALRRLRAAGVYVTFEEFKGRQEIVRGSERFAVSNRDFDNPFVAASYESSTGGSTGAGTRVGNDLDHIESCAANQMVLFEAYDALRLPLGLWRGTLPDGSGLNNVLRGVKMGRVAKRWFTPLMEDAAKPPLRFQVAGYLAVQIPRWCGVPIPWPEPLTHDEAIVVARWMRKMIDEHGGVQMNAPVSRSLRVALAARGAGIDLSGAVFLVAGEPPSAAKVAGIRSSGARLMVNYGFAEAGRVAVGCARPQCDTDMHLLTNSFAVHGWPREVPLSGEMVNALNITTLMASTPQILINAEIDDCGELEERRCGCPLDELGLHTHLSEVRSYRKLTGEGVTLMAGELLDVVERELPERFGGSLLDYQFVESEDERGFTVLTLRVSERVSGFDAAAMREAVFRALGRSSLMADSARNVWEQSGTLRVERGEPILNARGKLSPLFKMPKRSVAV